MDEGPAFEHYDEYWREVHGPKFAYDEPGSSSELVLRYDQVHRVAAAEVPPYRRPRWDGLAHITYRAREDVTRTLRRPRRARCWSRWPSCTATGCRGARAGWSGRSSPW